MELRAARGLKADFGPALPALIVAGLVLLSSSSAAGRGIAILTYRPVEAPASSAATTAEVARVARESGATTVLEPYQVATAQLAGGAVPADRMARFANVARLTEEGWRAYLAVEASFAAARLAEARRSAEGILDLEGGPAIYADISLRLGAVMLYLDRKREAEELFALAAALTPEREITIAEFAPDVVTAYAAATDLPRARATVRFAVPEASGATLEVDGRLLGPAPLAVDLAVGQHVVVARAPGWVARGSSFAVTAEGGEIAPPLDRDEDAAAVLEGQTALAIGTGEAAARRAVQGLMVYGDFDGVLLVAVVWRRGAPALLGQWCSGLPTGCGRVAEVGYAAPSGLRAAARLLWARIDRGGGDAAPTLLSDGRLVSAEKAPDDGNHRNGKSGRRWWKWAVAGVGAAALTAGAIFLATRDSEIQPIVIFDPCQFGGCQ